ncbi:hypothetical protein O0I10_005849 [Lichtheimia ornata]|uniref:Lipid droplet-associated perilipin protein n=1 Tax=Lichtheimia ornata TaxID=688661 RepID=A0AAD7V6F9_9FUNG|nr:uncharacterized protein O0I10_005849 [Lichtheimia ornata]KAJ8658496.1 hypothetical protein O0I10_005849 [Lichtheimia ornata]
MAINQTTQHENGHHEGHVKYSEATNGHLIENGQQQDANGQQQQRATSNGQASGFITRVTSYPIVVDGVSTVKAYAERSPAATYALSKASATLNSVNSYRPRYVQSYYETYIQPHVERADELGCKSLDLIQNRFPVVTQPTANVVDAVYPNRLISSIRSTSTAPVNVVHRRITTVLDSLEDTLDKYLPPPSSTAGDEKTRNGEKAKTTEVARVYGLVNAFSTRVRVKLAEQAPLQSAVARLQFVQETLRHSITVYSQAIQQRLPEAVTARFHQLHTVLTAELSHLAAKLELPPTIKERLRTLANSASEQYEFVKVQYARRDLSSYDKVKSITNHLQNQLLPLLKNIESQIKQYTELVRDKAKQDLHLRR